MITWRPLSEVLWAQFKACLVGLVEAQTYREVDLRGSHGGTALG